MSDVARLLALLFLQEPHDFGEPFGLRSLGLSLGAKPQGRRLSRATGFWEDMNPLTKKVKP